MWSTLPILGFDTETTGIDPRNDRLVTASVIIVDPERTTKHYWLADPEIEIPAQAAAVHGITTEHAREHGRDSKEVLEEIADLLHNHLSSGYPIVAYNAAYDLTLIECELERHGLPTLRERLQGDIAPIIDPYMLDRHADKYRKGKRRLENLAEHYGVSDDDAFHNAEADVLATLRVLGAMLRRFPELANTDFETLMKDQKTAYAEFMTYIAQRKAEAGEPFDEALGWPVAENI